MANMYFNVSSKYEKRFHTRSSHSAQILTWGYDALLAEYFVNLIRDGEFVFRISSRETAVPHPNFPHIKGGWRITELADVFLAFHDHIPEEHYTALIQNKAF